MMKGKLIPVLAVVSLFVMAVLLIFTSPMEIGPVGVLLFFTTLYVALFSTISLGMQIFYRLAFRRENFRRKDYLYAAVVAFGPIMLFMARSFNSINLWTVSLIVLFIILAEFLVAKRM